MSQQIVVTGTGTGIGKTVFSAGLTNLLGANYWKPIQAGLEGETDTQIVARLGGLSADRIVPERYRLTIRHGDFDAQRTVLAQRQAVGSDRAASANEPDRPGAPRRSTHISGIIHMLQCGARWRDCPSDYGPYTTIYNRFNRWAKRGHWQAIFEALARCGKDRVALSIDSTSIKAHRSASGGKGGSVNRRSAARAVGGPRKSTR